MGWPLRQEFQRSQGGSAIWTETLALPTGTKRYAFGPGVGLLGVGQYDARVTDASDLSRALPDRGGSLADAEYTITLADPDGALAAIIEGSQGRSIRGSAVTEQLGSPKVASFWWMTTFLGVIDRYSLVDRRSVQFTIRPNDLILRSPGFPRMAIEPSDWTGLPTSSASQYGPIIYGKHDAGASGTGQVPLIPLDSTGTKFLLTWGWAKSVDRVYSNKVLKILTTDYTISHPTTNSGRLCTVVTFVSAQGSNTITSDVQGLEDIGDGSGALIELTALQMKHVFVNFMVGDWMSGAWLADSTAPIAASAFVAHSQAYPNAKGSRRIWKSQKVRPLDEIANWQKSWEALIFWSNRGQLSVVPWPFHRLNIYMDETHLRYDKPNGKPPTFRTLDPDWDGIISKVTAQYQYSEAQAKFLGSLDVTDLATAAVEAPDSIDLPYSAAYQG